MTNVIHPVNAVTGAPAYSGKMARQAMGALAGGATTTRPLGARSGVRPGTPTTTVTATPTVWTVNPHAGILDVQTSAIAGPYQYAIDAAVTGAVTAANATNPRKDIVYVKLDDPAEGDGSSVPAVTPLYLAGTAAAVPVPPATPARSMVLAIINVPVSGGGSPTVTWSAPYIAGAGGRIVVRDTTERAAAGAAATAESPVYVHRTNAPAGLEREVTTDGGTTWRSEDGYSQAWASVPSATRAGETWWISDRFTMAISTNSGTGSWSGVPRFRTYAGANMVAPRIITLSDTFTPNGSGDVILNLSTALSVVESLSFVAVGTGTPIVATVVNATLATYTIRFFNGASVVTAPFLGLLTVVGQA